VRKYWEVDGFYAKLAERGFLLLGNSCNERLFEERKIYEKGQKEADVVRGSRIRVVK
jgi:hypothetical protein